MPAHPDRVRTAPLPEGYQFGDARPIDVDDAYPSAHNWVESAQWFQRLARRCAAQLPPAPTVSSGQPNRLLRIPFDPERPGAVEQAIRALATAVADEGVRAYCQQELHEAAEHSVRDGGVRVQRYWSLEKYRMVSEIAVAFQARELSALTPPLCGPGADYGAHVTANVIEGEDFASDAERTPPAEGFVVDRDCGDEG